MKSIEEVAKEYEATFGFNSIGEINASHSEAFKAGAEFVQLWINVEDELPDEYKPILFKTRRGCLYLGIYSTEKEYGNWFKDIEEADIDFCIDLDGEDEIISWRSINL